MEMEKSIFHTLISETISLSFPFYLTFFLFLPAKLSLDMFSERVYSVNAASRWNLFHFQNEPTMLLEILCVASRRSPIKIFMRA